MHPNELSFYISYEKIKDLYQTLKFLHLTSFVPRYYVQHGGHEVEFCLSVYFCQQRVMVLAEFLVKIQYFMM